MRDHMLRSRSFGRRTLVVGAAKLLLLSALGARLYYLQISQSEKYKTLADGNRIRLTPILPVRGKLLDRFGAELATNINHYKIYFDPTETKEQEQVLLDLIQILDMEDVRIEALYAKLLDKPREKLLITESVSWEEISRIEVKKTELPGVEVSSVPIRYYPLAESTAHVVGYLGATLEDEAKEDSLYKHPDYRIGKTGAEHMFERRLQGKVGMRQEEVDAHGYKVRELSVEHSSPGRELTLSLDAELQDYATNILKDKGGKVRSGGAVTVMDVHTGEIICMASTPAFNPNIFSEGITPEQLKALYTDVDKPMINKAIATQVPPGSTFKLMTSIAALEKGVINENTRHYCPGYHVYGNRRYHCWNERGHGQVRLQDAIAQSCNTFYYKIALDTGIDKIAEVSQRFGLGSLTGLGMLGETPGLVPTREWKRKLRNEDWYPGETINTSIGQGDMLVTPLQLVRMAAQIANGGRVITPTLLKISDEERAAMLADKEAKTVGVSDYHLRLVRLGMDRVVNYPLGTAHMSRIMDKEFAMAGKTGTVQVKRRVENERKDSIPRHLRNHALYVAFAPVQEPKFAISSFVEHGGSGSFAAAPVARDVLLMAQKLYKDKSSKGTNG